jgi:hypothetical protein
MSVSDAAGRVDLDRIAGAVAVPEAPTVLVAEPAPGGPEHPTTWTTIAIARAARKADRRRMVIDLAEDSPLREIDPIAPTALESRPPERE